MELFIHSQCKRWSLGMDILCYPALYKGYDYLSMLVLKLRQASKSGPSHHAMNVGYWWHFNITKMACRKILQSRSSWGLYWITTFKAVRYDVQEICIRLTLEIDIVKRPSGLITLQNNDKSLHAKKITIDNMSSYPFTIMPADLCYN